MKGTIAMRTKYFAGIVIAALALGTGLAVNSVGPLPSEDQSTPAMQVAHRLAGSVVHYCFDLTANPKRIGGAAFVEARTGALVDHFQSLRLHSRRHVWTADIARSRHDPAHP